MSQVIRIPESIYKRLESHAKGFDTPANVIERLLNFYERNASNVHKTIHSSFHSPLEETITDNIASGISIASNNKINKRNSIATGRFIRKLTDQTYTITSPTGITKTFKLPDKQNKQGIRNLTNDVEKFVEEQNGTEGQIKAARKKLTENGYHITK